MKEAARTHDDCDDDLTQQLCVMQGNDGDMHISTDGVRYLRFRMPIIGGGLSEHTYDALIKLMAAMEKDNCKCPIG